MEQQLPTLESFIDDILKEKSFQNLDPEVEAQLKQDLLSRVDDVINRELIDQLSDEKMTEFENLVDNGGSQEDLQQFLAANIPNMQEVVASALLKFRQQYLGA